MIALRRAKGRQSGRGKREVWLSFREHHLASGGSLSARPPRDAEILTYVREGALAYEDSMGRSGVIQAGEFQRRTAAGGLRHSEKNASRTDRTQVFQIWLRPSEPEREPGHEEKRFSAAQRRRGLCVVGSPDGRRGSLRIRRDALVYSAILDPGKHVVHELSPGRTAWLHVVQGALTLGDIVLTTGDGARVAAERAVSLTAREETEILLIDLRDTRPTSPRSG